MKSFAALFERLDQTTKTNEKVAAMTEYFSACWSGQATPSTRVDGAWALYYLSGRRGRRLIPTTRLRQWAAEAAGIPDWIFDESYDVVGDLAETITLVVPASGDPVQRSLTEWIERHVMTLSSLDEAQQRDAITAMWRQSDGTPRLILMKLITGAFRLGVSAKLVSRAIANATGLPRDVIAHRCMGQWQPSETFVESLLSSDTGDAVDGRPYPFCLAHAVPVAGDDPTQGDPVAPAIGAIEEFIAEWKWDGIRGQVIRRNRTTHVWSRGEELMNGRWPEVETAAEFLPDGTVIDGEILASRLVRDLTEYPTGVQVLPFAQLQRRIGRKTVGKKLLSEVPVMFHAFDCLESDGIDIRDRPLSVRQAKLKELIDATEPPNLIFNPSIDATSWSDLVDIRASSRQRHAEGLMLKRRDSIYHVGRVRGSWWKWKVAPYTVDAVLIYAQLGHGRRASLYTDYTFAVWDAGELVPFAKAYSGLTDAEIARVDRFVRENTSERFGPVRAVKPQLVMELAFEGLQRSTRHKSGIATRFPRIVRWRTDKQPADADRLADLLTMLPDSA
ncbi:MAG: ATP-dependent DNA ligase [Planctomycetota bacterium]